MAVLFGLGFWEIALILAAALLVFGPKKLPELARNLGKGIREFRRATDDFKSTIDEEAYRTQLPPTPNDAPALASETAAEVEAEPDAASPKQDPNPSDDPSPS